MSPYTPKRNSKNNKKILYLNIIIVFLIFLIGLIYFFKIQNVSENNFLIKDLKKRTAVLKEKNFYLTQEIALLESMENVDKNIFSQNFEKIDKIEFIKVEENNLVAKK